jgi:flagellar protein FlaC
MIIMKIRRHPSSTDNSQPQNQSNEENENHQQVPKIKFAGSENEGRKDINELRTIIKVEQPTKEDQQRIEQLVEKTILTKTSNAQIKKSDDEKPELKTQIKKDDDKKPELKKDLEEKREYLKAIKDFDFRINENKEKIDMVVEKINSLSKDIDDLVSLYEIVSDQMNPFVGLSRVTKDRIDALEHYQEEIKELKERLEHIELTGGSPKEYNDIIPGKLDYKEGKNPTQKQQQDTFSYDAFNTTDAEVSDQELDMILDESLKTLQPSRKIEQEILDFLNKKS